MKSTGSWMAVMSARRAGHDESGEGGPESDGPPERTSLGAAMNQYPNSLEGRFPVLFRGARGAQIVLHSGLLPSISVMKL